MTSWPIFSKGDSVWCKCKEDQYWAAGKVARVTTDGFDVDYFNGSTVTKQSYQFVIPLAAFKFSVKDKVLVLNEWRSCTVTGIVGKLCEIELEGNVTVHSVRPEQVKLVDKTKKSKGKGLKPGDRGFYEVSENLYKPAAVTAVMGDTISVSFLNGWSMPEVSIKDVYVDLKDHVEKEKEKHKVRRPTVRGMPFVTGDPELGLVSIKGEKALKHLDNVSLCRVPQLLDFYLAHGYDANSVPSVMQDPIFDDDFYGVLMEGGWCSFTGRLFALCYARFGKCSLLLFLFYVPFWLIAHTLPKCLDFLHLLSRKRTPLPNMGWGMLGHACYMDEKEAVSSLVAHGADVDRMYENGTTPLRICILRDADDCAKILLEADCKVDIVDKNGDNYLLLSVKHSVQNLRRAADGVNAEVTRANFMYLAANFVNEYLKLYHLQIIKLLVTYGCPINQLNADGVTAPMLLAEEGFHVQMELFLHKNTNWNLKLLSKKSVVNIMMESTDPVTVVICSILMEDSTALRREDYLTLGSLREVVKRAPNLFEKLMRLQLLKMVGTDLNVTDEKTQETVWVSVVLAFIAEGPYTNVVQQMSLLEANTQLLSQYRFPNNDTLLMRLVRGAKDFDTPTRSLVMYLLDAGTDVSVRDSDGLTALSIKPLCPAVGDFVRQACQDYQLINLGQENGVTALNQRNWLAPGQFHAFLSHHQAGAGFAMMQIKMDIALVKNCDPFKIFLDSDSLSSTRDLYSIVKNSALLLLIYTKELFHRPWCIYEMYAAIKEKVGMALLVLDKKAFDFRTSLQVLANPSEVEKIRNRPEDQRTIQIIEEQSGQSFESICAEVQKYCPDLIGRDYSFQGLIEERTLQLKKAISSFNFGDQKERLGSN